MVKSRNENAKYWSIQVTDGLDKEVEHIVQTDGHVSKSELVREAVRDHIRQIKARTVWGDLLGRSSKDHLRSAMRRNNPPIPHMPDD